MCKSCRVFLLPRIYLFFECSFTKRIWCTIMSFFLISKVHHCWDDLLDRGISSLKGSSLRATVCKMAWWSSAYHIWLQRNVIIHNSIVWTEEKIMKSIQKGIKARLCFRRKFHRSALNSSMCCNWGIDPSMVVLFYRSALFVLGAKFEPSCSGFQTLCLLVFCCTCHLVGSLTLNLCICLCWFQLQ
jgi:hypothetical protein